MRKNKTLFSGIVVDNEDPMKLNRVRVQIDTEHHESIIYSVPDTYNGKPTKDLTKIPVDLLPEFKWTKIDPLCFLPLLPLFIKVTPKKGEYVNLIFPNAEYKYIEQYYIQGTFSSPFTMYNEDGNASRLFATRDRIKDSLKPNNSKTVGVFPDYDDVSIQGRGTCDLIIKDNDVILRAGRSTKLPTNPKTILEAKPTRSFLQLSNFDTRIDYLGDTQTIILSPDNSFVKTLVEWTILNPENQFDNFKATISLYKLRQNTGYTTTTLSVDTNIPSTDKSLAVTMSFSGTQQNIVNSINDFLQQVNQGTLNIKPFPITNLTDQFPCFFRPSELTYNWLRQTSFSGNSEFLNITSFNNQIKFKTLVGNGLIFSNQLVGQQQIPKFVKTPKYSEQKISTTYGIMGGNKLLFLSHDSKIPNKQKITLGQNSLLGLTQDEIVQKILPNTDSFVRGEQLIELINLIVTFLSSHVHAFPGLPPNPVGTDGTQLQDVLTALQNAPNTILNQNIRIN
jgi:hypothetical protein